MSSGASTEPGSGSDAGASTQTGPQDTTTDADSTAGETFGEPGDDVSPQGITVDRVEVNQGIGFDVVRDGAPVDLDATEAPLVRGRPLLVRALWALDDDWSPRSIRAVLTTTSPGEEPQQWTSVVWIDGPAAIDRLDGGFQWELPPATVLPGLEISVALYDVEGDPSNGGDAVRVPADGSIGLAVGAREQTLSLMVVPVNYDVGSCSSPAEISDAELEPFRAGLFQVLPVTDVDITLHEPIEWTTALTSWEQLNLGLQELRESEGAEPWVYYYGVLGRPCDDALEPDRGGALAWLTADPPRREDGPLRVASSRYSFFDQFEYAVMECVRQVGVSLGRGRIGCPARAAGEFEDTDAPEDGALANWGYGVLDRSLRAPGAIWDSMSECNPRWVTRHGWSRLYPVLEAVSGWEAEDEGR